MQHSTLPSFPLIISPAASPFVIASSPPRHLHWCRRPPIPTSVAAKFETPGPRDMPADSFLPLRRHQAMSVMGVAGEPEVPCHHTATISPPCRHHTAMVHTSGPAAFPTLRCAHTLIVCAPATGPGSVPFGVPSARVPVGVGGPCCEDNLPSNRKYSLSSCE